MALPALVNAGLADLMSPKPLVARVVESSGGANYVYSWWGTGSQQSISGVKKGDLVLVVSGEQTKLECPVRGFLITARQQWCDRVPATGQLIHGSLEQQPRDSPLKEEIEALLLIRLPEGKLMPVTWRTRKGACRGLETCMRELLAAATPEWAQRSEAHRVVAELPSPWMRFVVEIDHRLEPPKQAGGNSYPVTSAVCRPIDPDMFAMLKTFLNDEANVRLMIDVYAGHQAKLKEVDTKLVA